MSNPTPCLWNVRWDCPNNGLALEGIRTAPIDPLNATKAPFIPMTDDIRVQLAKKLGWRYHEPKPPWVGYWVNPVGNPTELPSLYDLCLDGEERLTHIRQKQLFMTKLAKREHFARLLHIETAELFERIRLSNLPERARALIEVL